MTKDDKENPAVAYGLKLPAKVKFKVLGDDEGARKNGFMPGNTAAMGEDEDVIDGNHRLEAAKRLGMTHIPVRVSHDYHPDTEEGLDEMGPGGWFHVDRDKLIPTQECDDSYHDGHSDVVNAHVDRILDGHEKPLSVGAHVHHDSSCPKCFESNKFCGRSDHYLVHNGHHRLEAHKELGNSRVKVRLGGVLDADESLDEMGKHGFWDKEGYKISHEHDPRDGYVIVHAHDSKGENVGNLYAGPSSSEKGKLHATVVRVEEPHRRKGLATAMYDRASEVTGMKFRTGNQTKDGKAFRRKYDRKRVNESIEEMRLGTAKISFGKRNLDRFSKTHDHVDAIAHGKPITLPYTRKTYPHAPTMGSQFGQDVEPHGEYMSHGHRAPGWDPKHGERREDNSVNGTVHWKNPYVHRGTSENYTWKQDLAAKFGKKGKALTNHLKKLGHDGLIVLPSKGNHPTEMVNFSGRRIIHEEALVERKTSHPHEGQPWHVKGSDFGLQFHGGPQGIRKVEPSKLQSMHGGYHQSGPGFYTAPSNRTARYWASGANTWSPGVRHVMKTNYPTPTSGDQLGPRPHHTISVFKAHPDANILVVPEHTHHLNQRSSNLAKTRDRKTFDEIQRHHNEHFDQHHRVLPAGGGPKNLSNPAHKDYYRLAAHHYARHHGYDAVHFKGPEGYNRVNTDVETVWVNPERLVRVSNRVAKRRGWKRRDESLQEDANHPLHDRLRKATSSSEAYKILDAHPERPASYQSGGCWTLARALHRHLGDEAQIVDVVNHGTGKTEHVAVHHKGHILDADGATPAHSFIDTYRSREPHLKSARIAVEPHDPARAKASGLVTDDRATDALHGHLKGHLNESESSKVTRHPNRPRRIGPKGVYPDHIRKKLEQRAEAEGKLKRFKLKEEKSHPHEGQPWHKKASEISNLHYHTGPQGIRKIKPERLQNRYRGYGRSGPGFYTTPQPVGARAWGQTVGPNDPHVRHVKPQQPHDAYPKPHLTTTVFKPRKGANVLHIPSARQAKGDDPRVKELQRHHDTHIRKGVNLGDLPHDRVAWSMSPQLTHEGEQSYAEVAHHYARHHGYDAIHFEHNEPYNDTGTETVWINHSKLTPVPNRVAKRRGWKRHDEETMNLAFKPLDEIAAGRKDLQPLANQSTEHPSDFEWEATEKKPHWRNIVKHYDEASPATRRLGAEAYKDYRQAAKSINRKHLGRRRSASDLDRTIATISATSPRTNVRRNMEVAARAVRTGKASGVSGATVANDIIKKDAPHVFTARKTGSFHNNILHGHTGGRPAHAGHYATGSFDHSDRTTNDTNFLGVAINQRITKNDHPNASMIFSQSPKGRQHYDHLTKMAHTATRHINKKYGTNYTPQQIQAITWYHYRQKHGIDDAVHGSGASKNTAGKIAHGRPRRLPEGSQVAFRPLNENFDPALSERSDRKAGADSEAHPHANKPYYRSGKDLDKPFYHGSYVGVRKVDPSKLQVFNRGVHGKGYYTTTSLQHAQKYAAGRTRLGKIEKRKVVDPNASSSGLVSVHASRPDAHILRSGYSEKTSHPKLVADIKAHDSEYRDYGDQGYGTRTWKHAVSRYGDFHGYDAVHFKEPGDPHDHLVWKKYDKLSHVPRKTAKKKGILGESGLPRVHLIGPVYEELNPEQKREVDTWDKGKHTFSDHVFGGPIETHHTTTIPLLPGGTSAHVNVHPEVQKHLADHGYAVHDHKAGLAKKHDGSDDRVMRIGKLLNKTGAPDHIKKKFTHGREGIHKVNDDYHVVITRHPHHVAGMSTNKGWKSCMSMAPGHPAGQGGSLKADVEHGTHVAYLIHKNDKDLKAPVARIALKPFHGSHAAVDSQGKVNLTKEKHTILRPEPQHYGTAPEEFHKAVSGWAKKHFELHPGRMYTKNKALYHDGGPLEIFTGSHPHLHASDPDDRIRAVHHPQNSAMDLHRIATTDPDHSVRQAVIYHPNVSIGTLSHLANDEHHEIRRGVLHHPDTPNHVKTHIVAKEHHKGMLMTALASDHPTPLGSHAIEQIHHRFKDDPSFTRVIAQHRNTPPQILQGLARSKDVSIQSAVADNRSASHADLEHLAAPGNHHNVHRILADNPRTPASALHKLALHHITPEAQSSSGQSHHVLNAIAGHNNTSSETLHHIATSHDYTSRSFDRVRNEIPLKITYHHRASGDTLHHITTHAREGLSSKRIAEHPNVKDETLHHIMNHEDYSWEGHRAGRREAKRRLDQREQTDHLAKELSQESAMTFPKTAPGRDPFRDRLIEQLRKASLTETAPREQDRFDFMPSYSSPTPAHQKFLDRRKASKEAVALAVKQNLAAAGSHKMVVIRSTHPDPEHPSRNLYHVIHPSAKKPGIWQVSQFDAKTHQPIGDFESFDRHSAIRSLSGEWTQEHGVPWGSPHHKLQPYKPGMTLEGVQLPLDLLEEKPKYDYNSTQINVRGKSAEIHRKLAKSIPRKDLATGGRVDEPHVTVKFGLHDYNPDAVAKAAKGARAFKARLGKVRVFPATKDRPSDVVVVDVKSPHLKKLNRKVSKLPNSDKHKTYKPHMTLAFVKPGKGEEHARRLSREAVGHEIDADHIKVSDRNGEGIEIPLRKPKKKRG